MHAVKFEEVKGIRRTMAPDGRGFSFENTSKAISDKSGEKGGFRRVVGGKSQFNAGITCRPTHSSHYTSFSFFFLSFIFFFPLQDEKTFLYLLAFMKDDFWENGFLLLQIHISVDRYFPIGFCGLLSRLGANFLRFSTLKISFLTPIFVFRK